MIDEFKDPEENVYGIHGKLNGQLVNLISRYGPNLNNQNDRFFTCLNRFLATHRDFATVIGGDWNATFSLDNTDNNIDTFSMAGPPSILRSRLIADCCENFQLTDPFRALHADRRDFTYYPRTRRVNRSRLDFFLISDTLVTSVSSCEIAPYLGSDLFDHKSVSLALNKPDFKPIQSINLCTLSHPRFKHVVAGAAAECHLQHADAPEAVRLGINLDDGLQEIGMFIQKIREINELEMLIADEGLTDFRELSLAEKNTELEALFENLPNPDQLAIIPLNCNPDVFLEVLMGYIRDSVISLQSWVRKISNVKKNRIIKRINMLRDDFLINSAPIAELESELNGIVEANLQLRVKNMKIFEHLNNEKPTGLFLSLAKKNSGGESQNKIRNVDNTPFPDPESRNEHITRFFENLYAKDPLEPASLDGEIERFLGNEIVNSVVVRNSKLTPEEVNNMESLISLEELDKSLKEGNSKSAPGVDGFGMPIIKKIWSYVRQPLQKYANHCFETGTLTENFRGATIRLIPKKSDATFLKNWRPISLLSNLYKLLSRAINCRLNGVVNRICSRAQKGFNSKRYTQEVIINVWESIAYCKTNNIKGAIMAVDMAKAFDTVSSKFVEEVYKFFGFGPVMRKWLSLLGNNRFACILLEGGKLSRKFSLGRGRPQGDVISPNTFNFVVQILIFKLELDPGIKKIPRPDNTVINHNQHSFFMYESNRETDTNESLADDNTTITLMDLESLGKVKNALENFAKISGLRCNYDKSVIMPTFDITQMEKAEIETLGFSVENKITLLGVEITYKLDNIRVITLKIKEKIINLIAFWERFRLSLPGRIAILKTCLISQICYLGCILPLDPIVVNEIQSLLDGFVRKNLRISAERFYLPPRVGGVGAIELKTFLICLNLSWVHRAHNFCIDNWRYDLTRCAPNHNLLLLRSSDVDVSANPILHHMAKNFENFYANFSAINGNYKEAFVFKNMTFSFGLNGQQSFNEEFFGRAFYNRHLNRIRTLKFCDLFHGNRVKTRDELTADGLPVSAATCLRIQLAATGLRTSLRKADESDLICLSVLSFFDSIKKGSKKFRLVFSTNATSDITVNNLRIVNSFATVSNTVIPAPELTQMCLSSWNMSFLHNDLKDFIFKFRNNQLYTNNRLHAVDGLTNPACTFCRIKGIIPLPDESFCHLFFDCCTTKTLLTAWTASMEPVPDFTTEEARLAFWYGTGNLVAPENYSKYITFLYDCFRYILWKFRLRKKLPNPTSFAKELDFFILVTVKGSGSFKNKISKINSIANLLPALG